MCRLWQCICDSTGLAQGICTRPKTSLECAHSMLWEMQPPRRWKCILEKNLLKGVEIFFPLNLNGVIYVCQSPAKLVYMVSLLGSAQETARQDKPEAPNPMPLPLIKFPKLIEFIYLCVCNAWSISYTMTLPTLGPKLTTWDGHHIWYCFSPSCVLKMATRKQKISRDMWSCKIWMVSSESETQKLEKPPGTLSGSCFKFMFHLSHISKTKHLCLFLMMYVYKLKITMRGWGIPNKGRSEVGEVSIYNVV